jgi:hypothetical protein
MNRDQFLTRIYALARRAPAPEPAEIPLGMETAVLAHWRAAAGRSSAGVLPGLRWAALAACVIALLAGAVQNDELSALRSSFDPTARVADSALVSGLDYE